jgi:hypothetical protein
VFDRCSKRDAGIHGEIPHWTPKTKAVNQIKGDRHVIWIDRYNLVVHLRVVHIAIWKVNLVGIDIGIGCDEKCNYKTYQNLPKVNLGSLFAEQFAQRVPLAIGHGQQSRRSIGLNEYSVLVIDGF